MRIGELAEANGTTTKTLRFYEDLGLLPPVERTASGYRDFSADAVGRIEFVRRGRAAGLTLAQIGQVLKIREDGQAPCSHVRELLGQRLRDIEGQIAELLTLRETIAELHTQAAKPDPETCSADEVCRYI